MSEISLWFNYGNQLLSLIVTILTSIYSWFAAYVWLTQNGNLFFSGVVAISTVVYAILTWQLVSETRIMRKVQTEPNLYMFIESRDEHAEITDMFMQNIGMGVARNIKFNVLSDFMYYRDNSSKKDYWLKDIHLLENGFEALAPNQKIRVFSTSYRDVRDLNSKTYFEICIKYTNFKDDKYDSVYLFDFLTLPPIGMGKHDHILDSVRGIEGNIKKISSNMGKFVGYSIDSKGIMHLDSSNLLFTAKNEKERIEISKHLIKKTLLKFYYDWKTCSQYHNRNVTDSMLRLHSSIFLEVATDVTSVFPEKLIGDLLSLVTEMNLLIHESNLADNREYINRLEELANRILLMYGNFDQYFVN
jgi:hypothetical protein